MPAHEFEELLVLESIRPVFSRVADRVQRRPQIAHQAVR